MYKLRLTYQKILLKKVLITYSKTSKLSFKSKKGLIYCYISLLMLIIITIAEIQLSLRKITDCHFLKRMC